MLEVAEVIYETCRLTLFNKEDFSTLFIFIGAV